MWSRWKTFHKREHLQAHVRRAALVAIEAVHSAVIQRPLQHGLNKWMALVYVSSEQERQIFAYRQSAEPQKAHRLLTGRESSVFAAQDRFR